VALASIVRWPVSSANAEGPAVTHFGKLAHDKTRHHRPTATICHDDQVARRAVVMQHKTPRPVQFEITAATRDARTTGGWVEKLGLHPAGYGTHSMQRTKAVLIYRRTKNLRAMQLLLGHCKLESTLRHLGIEVDDALEISEQTES
jgi:hypothetical protein